MEDDRHMRFDAEIAVVAGREEVRDDRRDPADAFVREKIPLFAGRGSRSPSLMWTWTIWSRNRS